MTESEVSAGRKYILANKRVDPDTNAPLPSIDLVVQVEEVSEEDYREVERDDGTKKRIRFGRRVVFLYVDDATNRKIGVAGIHGSYSLKTFCENARPIH